MKTNQVIQDVNTFIKEHGLLDQKEMVNVEHDFKYMTYILDDDMETLSSIPVSVMSDVFLQAQYPVGKDESLLSFFAAYGMYVNSVQVIPNPLAKHSFDFQALLKYTEDLDYYDEPVYEIDIPSYGVDVMSGPLYKNIAPGESSPLDGAGIQKVQAVREKLDGMQVVLIVIQTELQKIGLLVYPDRVVPCAADHSAVFEFYDGKLYKLTAEPLVADFAFCDHPWKDSLDKKPSEGLIALVDGVEYKVKYEKDATLLAVRGKGQDTFVTHENFQICVAGEVVEPRKFYDVDVVEGKVLRERPDKRYADTKIAVSAIRSSPNPDQFTSYVEKESVVVEPQWFREFSGVFQDKKKVISDMMRKMGGHHGVDRHSVFADFIISGQGNNLAQFERWCREKHIYFYRKLRVDLRARTTRLRYYVPKHLEPYANRKYYTMLQPNRMPVYAVDIKPQRALYIVKFTASVLRYALIFMICVVYGGGK